MKLLQSESSLQKACLQYLSMLPESFFDRCNTGAVVGEYKGRRRFTRFGRPGQPDIVGCHRGRYVSFEVKGLKGKQNSNQLEFERRVKAAGGFYRVVRSVDELIEAIDELKQETAND